MTGFMVIHLRHYSRRSRKERLSVAQMLKLTRRHANTDGRTQRNVFVCFVSLINQQSKERMNPHKCPVCDGSGSVSRPPWVAGDQQTWVTSGEMSFPCNACYGTGVLSSDPTVRFLPRLIEFLYNKYKPTTIEGSTPR